MLLTTCKIAGQIICLLSRGLSTCAWRVCVCVCVCVCACAGGFGEHVVSVYSDDLGKTWNGQWRVHRCLKPVVIITGTAHTIRTCAYHARRMECI